MNKIIKKYMIYTVIMSVFALFLSCTAAVDKPSDPDDTKPPVKQELRAGTSASNIVPSSFKERNVHDPLFAKTIVLDNGIGRLMFIIVDNQGLPSFLINEAKEAIFRETRIHPDNILIASTHTHTSILAGMETDLAYSSSSSIKFNEYQTFVIDQIVVGAKAAVTNLQPAKIGFGSFDKPEHVFNRRWYMKNFAMNPFGILDSVKMNPSFQHPDLLRPAGPIDPEISFIAIKSASDEPIAILANYSLHYVGSPATDVSADYFGEFGKQVGNLLNAKNESFLGIMSNGTSGDVNNHNYAVAYHGMPHYDRARGVAEDIAKGVVEEYNKIEFLEWVPLKVASKSIRLNRRVPSNELLQKKELIEQHTGSTPLFHADEKYYSTRINNYLNLFPSTITAKIQAFTIGDLAIGAIPFEVFAETGLELKKLNPFKNSFTIGLANGHWGYLPTPQQHKKGGYESWITVNRVQTDASEILVNELTQLFNSLK